MAKLINSKKFQLPMSLIRWTWDCIKDSKLRHKWISISCHWNVWNEPVSAATDTNQIKLSSNSTPPSSVTLIWFSSLQFDGQLLHTNLVAHVTKFPVISLYWFASFSRPNRIDILSSSSSPSSWETITHKFVLPFQQTMAIVEASTWIVSGVCFPETKQWSLRT